MIKFIAWVVANFNLESIWFIVLLGLCVDLLDVGIIILSVTFNLYHIQTYKV